MNYLLKFIKHILLEVIMKKILTVLIVFIVFFSINISAESEKKHSEQISLSGDAFLEIPLSNWTELN